MASEDLGATRRGAQDLGLPGAPWGSLLFLSILPPPAHSQAALSALSLPPENSSSFTEMLSRADCSLVLGRDGCGPFGQLTAIFNILESLPHPDEMLERDGKYVHSYFHMSGSSHVLFRQTAP